MSKPKPFPAITGSCVCNTVRYRLLTSPLYCYACHCADCQKSSGGAFGWFLNIEAYNISIISPTHPVIVAREKKPGALDRHMECPKCKTELWSNNVLGTAICSIRVGTLDFPSLMEPDVHSYVGSKVEWIKLPEGAKTTEKEVNHKELWPKSSLKRLEICMARVAETTRKKQAALAEPQEGTTGGGGEGDAEGTGGEGEKTPTAVEFEDKDAEDDEAFEKRFKETEKALQERLEKLSLKLEEEEVTKKARELTL
ncbi:uncharacterized protein K460DRAFT_365118 [Cucurbitaria berberidis CBS 394.84]|uniref:CENP-V/GFA domain-containing protein n=1 Tax=Cucurbitaria berberidis CBS 394.84 TaxID=1168544 RepID=A0A9P4GMM2_9PLEO|nr:uncharacterized protein K460DRAFT_365118 [Cucurbitaria berberidis CBS 394.84]KAF1849213.1 hypothetical protein K460DRAFT_365118 [Cucurbitaria berberidis CBS 394.84]